MDSGGRQHDAELLLLLLYIQSEWTFVSCIIIMLDGLSCPLIMIDE